MDKLRKLYITDYCLTPHENVPRSGILCKGDKITAVGGASAFSREEDMEIVELPGTYAVPGFIDTHINGAGGFDASTSYERGADMGSMCKVLASHGVTSFVPTIVSAPFDKMILAISSTVKMLDGGYNGAVPVGLHIEGPFINKEKHGSQRMEDILGQVDLGMLREIIAEGRGRIKLFTFAPELSGSLKLIEMLLENGIKPSMGHSLASEEEVLRAVEAGVCRCTHLYNGMPALHHRDIALTAVALTDDRISIELILDGEHLHPRMVDLACRSKPKDKLIGVSDAIQGLGLNDGKYHLGVSKIRVKDGVVTTEDGVLAGTTLTLEKGWQHLVTYSHLRATEAAACFTINPARDIGLENTGELRPGKLADISFFDTATNKTRLTVSKGRIVYDSEGKYLKEAEELPNFP